MPKPFSTEIRKVFDNEYVKVSFNNTSDVYIMHPLIQNLKPVRKANITNNKKGDDLTVYPTSFYSSEEVQKEVTTFLNRYYAQTPEEHAPIQRTISLIPNLSNHRNLLESALSSYNRGEYRHSLDDLRLCIELMMRDLLGNEKSLENQKQLLGTYLKDRGVSTEIRNMLIASLDSFCKYSNEHVKHKTDITRIDLQPVLAWANMLLEQLTFLSSKE